MKKSKSMTTLYDAGGWFLVGILLGVYFVGVVADYFWNYLVLYVTLRKLPGNGDSQGAISLARRITAARKHIYCGIITVLGLAIDWLYYELTWGFLVVGSLRVSPLFPRPGIRPALEFATILVPMAVLMVVNMALSRFYFHLTTRQAVLFGLAMGFFTAPWLIVIAVLYF